MSTDRLPLTQDAIPDARRHIYDADPVLSARDLVITFGRVVGLEKGPKIRGFKYKNKSNQRTRWGHRQKYDLVEITGITKG